MPCSDLPQAATASYPPTRAAPLVALPADADMHLPQALEHGVDAADSSEEDEGEPGEQTYVQEQQDLKRSFLQVWQLFSADCWEALVCCVHKTVTFLGHEQMLKQNPTQNQHRKARNGKQGQERKDRKQTNKRKDFKTVSKSL